MLRIGLTGGIGSGKTTVAQIFEVLGIPVYYADQKAKDLMNSDPRLKEKIMAAFGRDLYPGGILDRARLAKLVFGNSEKLKRLNALVHPVTIEDGEHWLQEQKSAYVIREAAIIFEAGLESMYDYIIGVTAPEELRIERVKQRDTKTAAEVMQRIQHQMDESEKMQRCDFVIQNDGRQPLLPQVLQIHQKLISLQPVD